MLTTDGAADLLLKAIRRSDTVRERTGLIVFLGTPHRGSTYANWGQIASKLARIALQDSNKKIVDTLEVNNEVLDNIHEEFKRIVYRGRIKIHSFQEARGVTGVRGLEGKVSMLRELLCKTDSSRRSMTIRLNLPFHEMSKLSRVSMRITCRWLGAAAEMIKFTVSSPAS